MQAFLIRCNQIRFIYIFTKIGRKSGTFITLVLLGCTINRNPEPPKPNLPSQIKSKTIIVWNSLSEDLSIIESFTDKPRLLNQVKIKNKDGSPARACQAGNHFSRFSNYLLLTCSLSQELQLLNKKTLTLEKIIELPNSTNPWATVRVNSQKVVVSSYFLEKLFFVDVKTSTIKSSIDFSKTNLTKDANSTTKSFPHGLIYDDGRLYVTLANLKLSPYRNLVAGGPGHVAVIDVKNHPKLIKTIPVSGRNTVAASKKNIAKLQNYIILTSTGDYNDQTKSYTGNGKIDFLNKKTLIVEDSISVTGAPLEIVIDNEGIAYLPNGIDGKILRIDLINKQKLSSFDISRNQCNRYSAGATSYVSSLAIYDDMLIATEFNSDCLLVLDKDTGKIRNQFTVGDGPDAITIF